MAYLGPLTTTFTPADESICLTSFFYGTNSLGSWLQLGTTDTTSCLPTRFDRTASFYYSPGICPSGYNYACTLASSSNNSPMTIATCCPRGYACVQNGGSDQVFPCSSSLPSRATLTLSSIGFGASYSGSGSTTLAVTAGETVRAYGPIVRRQGTDPTWDLAAATATTSAGTAATATSTGGGGSSASSSAAGASSSSSSSSGLSAGAKAGIGVGVGVGVLCILAASVGGFLFGKRRARRRGEAAVGGAASSDGVGGGAEKYQHGGELAGRQVQEMPTQDRYELPPHGSEPREPVLELDGEERAREEAKVRM